MPATCEMCRQRLRRATKTCKNKFCKTYKKVKDNRGIWLKELKQQMQRARPRADADILPETPKRKTPKINPLLKRSIQRWKAHKRYRICEKSAPLPLPCMAGAGPDGLHNEPEAEAEARAKEIKQPLIIYCKQLVASWLRIKWLMINH